MNALGLLTAPMSAPVRQLCDQHGEYDARQIGDRWTGCPGCFQAEIQRLRVESARELAAELRADRVKAMLAVAGIPPRYLGYALGDFGTSGAAAWQWLKRAAAGDPGALAINGPVGTGKTALACALVRTAAERGLFARYARTFDLRDRTRAAWDGEGSEARAMEWFTEPRILVVDEIGLGVTTASDAERLHAMLDRRYLDAKPTVVVTNLDSDGVRAALGERAHDRLRDGATVITVVGPSKRKPRGAA